MNYEKDLLESILEEQQTTNDLLRIIKSNSEQTTQLQEKVIRDLFVSNETNSQVEISIVDESR